jgi:hypothetical protein
VSFPSDLCIESFRGYARPETFTAAAAHLLNKASGVGVVAAEWPALLESMAARADLSLTAEQRVLAPSWTAVLPLVSRALDEHFAGKCQLAPALVSQMALAADAAA